MDKIIGSYLESEITLSEIERWLRGDPDPGWADQTSEPAKFIATFLDQLHLSFHWFLKQPKNILVKPIAAAAANLNLDDEDSFPSLGDGSSAVCSGGKFKKRIKPTSLGKILPGHCENSPFTNDQGSTVSGRKISARNQDEDFCKEERELLKNFKINLSLNSNIQQRFDRSKTITATKTEPNETPSVVAIEPQYQKVTFVEQILSIKNLYIFLAVNNFAPSIFEEIKFVMESLTKKSVIEKNAVMEEETGIKPKRLTKIFSSYHNCFHFAFLAFEEILLKHSFIGLFNVNAIHYILDNSFLLNFKCDSSIKLLINEFLSKKIMPVVPSKEFNDSNSYVCYQPDTDGKPNFPNDSSFATFRRQRDEFYRLFRKYQDNSWFTSMCHDRSTQSIFELAVRNIFAMTKDVGNSYHLARLFVDQLIKSFRVESFDSNATNRGNTTNTKVLPSKQSTDGFVVVNQDRLNKLQNRIVKKNHSENFVAENLFDDHFTPKERFFRDFIFYADCHTFNKQLKMILKHRLIESTSGASILLDQERQDVEKNSFLHHLSTLNLLARFAGFVCFYPLESRKYDAKCWQNNFYEQQKTLRDLNPFGMFDFETYLVNSIQNHSLVVAIPWTVEFLLFVDQISLTQTKFSDLFSLLVMIYKFYLPKLTEFSRSRHTRIFLQFCLEKLFITKKIDVLERLEPLLKNQKELATRIFCDKSVMDNTSCLDLHPDMVDLSNMSYLFPQFSKAIMEILQQSTEIRKITPTTLQSVKKSPGGSIKAKNKIDMDDDRRKEFQSQIEDSFLNIYSSSLKRCIFFLNDRISANCIKQIKKEIYPGLRNKLRNDAGIMENVIMGNAISNIDPKIGQSTRDECKTVVRKYATETSQMLFPYIIPDELDQEGIDFLIGFSLQKILERCNWWIEANLLDEIILNDLMTTSSAYRSEDQAKTHENRDLECQIYFKQFETCVIQLRDTLESLLQENQDLTIIEPEVLLTDAKKCRNLKYCIHSSNQNFIDLLVLDLGLSLVTFKPSCLTDQVLDTLSDYYTTHHVKYHQIICPKYLYMLNRSPSTTSTWAKFETLLKRLLRDKCYEFQELEKDTLAVMKNSDWDNELLTRFATVLNSLVDFVRTNNLCHENGDNLEILDWLSWFCGQTECETFES